MAKKRPDKPQPSNFDKQYKKNNTRTLAQIAQRAREIFAPSSSANNGNRRPSDPEDFGKEIRNQFTESSNRLNQKSGRDSVAFSKATGNLVNTKEEALDGAEEKVSEYGIANPSSERNIDKTANFQTALSRSQSEQSLNAEQEKSTHPLKRSQSEKHLKTFREDPDESYRMQRSQSEKQMRPSAEKSGHVKSTGGAEPKGSSNIGTDESSKVKSNSGMSNKMERGKLLSQNKNHRTAAKVITPAVSDAQLLAVRQQQQRIQQKPPTSPAPPIIPPSSPPQSEAANHRSGKPTFIQRIRNYITKIFGSGSSADNEKKSTEAPKEQKGDSLAMSDNNLIGKGKPLDRGAKETEVSENKSPPQLSSAAPKQQSVKTPTRPAPLPPQSPTASQSSSDKKSERPNSPPPPPPLPTANQSSSDKKLERPNSPPPPPPLPTANHKASTAKNGDQSFAEKISDGHANLKAGNNGMTR